LRGFTSFPSQSLSNSALPYIPTVKFLGLILDSKL
jgi:hypothetical protein